MVKLSKKKVIVGVINKSIEEYLQNHRDLDVCEVVVNEIALCEAIKIYEPEITILSYSFESLNLKKILIKITSNQFSFTRVIFLCGNEEKETADFINFLISRGIYDFYVGSVLDQNVIEKLLYNPRNRQEVQSYIYKPPDLKESKLTTEDKEKLVKQHINKLSYDEKKELGFIETKEIEYTITEDRIVGTVVIAISGAMNRVGTTHLSICTSQYLKNLGFEVALVEMNKSECFRIIKDSYEKYISANDHFMLAGVDFYPYSNLLRVPDLIHKNYQYIVLDMGVFEECDQEEFQRAHQNIIVNGIATWELRNLESILAKLSWTKKIKYCFNHADDNNFKMISESMDNLKCYRIPHNPEPFNLEDEYLDFLNRILAEVIPTKKRKIRKRLFPEVLVKKSFLMDRIKESMKKDGASSVEEGDGRFAVAIANAEKKGSVASFYILVIYMVLFCVLGVWLFYLINMAVNGKPEFEFRIF
jgi:hypothetical protein